MDTQNLQAFIAVAEEKSFSTAAEKLHITQPAVSKRIAALESQLECQLFDRISRSIQLTESGHALLPRAEQILQSVEQAKRSIIDLQGEVSGSLRMGISHHIGLHRLPPVLKEFHRSFPQVRFDIAFMDSEEAYEQVANGRIELGVVTLDPTGNTPLSRQPIWQDELLIVTAPDHPLAINNERLDLRMLSQYPAILPGMNTYTGQIVKRIFQRKKLKLDASMETNYLETIKMMVSIGLGWSVLPHTMVNDNIIGLTVADVSLHRTLGYVTNRQHSLSNAASMFIQTLRKHATLTNA